MSWPLHVHHVRAVGTSQPTSILQLWVSFTNSHLSPISFPKSSTNVEGRAKCAQSFQAWPRSGGQTERAGSAPHVASWMPTLPEAPGCAVWQTCLHLIENAEWMACQTRGDPKWVVPALVIYLSAANPRRVQPEAGYGSVRNTSAYSQTWQLKTTWGREKGLKCSKRKAKTS